MKNKSHAIKSVLVLGSGALKIAQAGEFDYSGSQALKAFKEEGLRTILINPNIATIQTSEELADEIYFLPVTPEFVTQVIEKERPDAIALSFGGQTGLNCGVELERSGVLEKYHVQVLGTPVKAIELTEDRQLFADHLRSIHIPTPQSVATETVTEARKVAQDIGYPVMVRAAYTLGGQSSGVVWNEQELNDKLEEAFQFTHQVLVEQYLHHFKEIEYEVVRDAFDNCITVCNMENFDPLGIHTGESIVVAPSQTLTNQEYHFLRKKAIEIVRSLGIVGECNVQYALNPKNSIATNGAVEQGIDMTFDEPDYSVIEVNARLSRSSALASKATGYPLAYVAAKLGLGMALQDIPNQVTQKTKSFFEPSLDYIVVKFPRWDLEKFKGVEEKIGSSMKSVGEVMAIGRNFEETIQKAVRMLDTGMQGVTDGSFPQDTEELLNAYIKRATPKRIFAICEALKRDVSIERIHELSGVDPWFLYRLKHIVTVEQSLKTGDVNIEDADSMRAVKQAGFSDKKIAQIVGSTELRIRAQRKALGITPAFLQMDTLAGEVPAPTNYLYGTYNATHTDVKPFGKRGIMVLGSGPYRIGSSVEFDWSCVNTAQSLKRYKKKSIIINCNPETVSTDYDISDRLYFEQLTFERIADIYEFEDSFGVIVSVGGQTPNNVTPQLHKYHIPIMGTSPEDIDRAENRSKFSALLDSLGIRQPEWRSFTTQEELEQFIDAVGYPVLIRPSYVLSGAAMNVCYSPEELHLFLTQAQDVSSEFPITVSQFIDGAKEIEYDAIAQGGKVQVYAISEHIEYAGVHSGDATIAYPPQRIFMRTEKDIIDCAEEIAKALKITGPFNIQFLAKENKVYVIEVNVRASRTLPFISKATGVNFAHVLVDALFDNSKRIPISYPDYVVVKSPQFSFARLAGADPLLRVEMASTGEAASFGDTLEEAFLKAEMSVGFHIPKKGVFVSLGGDENKLRFEPHMWRLKRLGVPIYATRNTAKLLQEHGVPAIGLNKIYEKVSPNPLDIIREGKIDFAINIVEVEKIKDNVDNLKIRRAVVDHNIPLVTDRRKAELYLVALTEKKSADLKIKAWGEYGK